MITCQFDVDVVPLNVLPIVPLSSASSDTSLSDEDLSAPLSEEGIHTAISSGGPEGLLVWMELPCKC